MIGKQRSGGLNGPHPDRVVAIGGGTGLPAVLRGLRSLIARGDVDALTAIVTMSDDGGSSGRLRRDRGLPPPGDVRNCLVALSEEEDLIAGLFQHRYAGGEGLGGHNLGNLILAALAEQTGSFLNAVEVSSRVLRTVGRILPVTHDDVTLEAILEDGSSLVGESAIGQCPERIRQVLLRPESAQPTPGVVEAIIEANLVVLGPGSLFTSIVPNLLLPDVAHALRETEAVRVLVGNLVSERTEGLGLNLQDHLEVIEAHAGGTVVDAVLLHEGEIDEVTLRRYEAEGAIPLSAIDDSKPRRVHVVQRHLLAAGPKLRHEPSSTATGLLEAWRQLSVPVGVSERR